MQQGNRMNRETAFGGWLKQRRKEQGIGSEDLAERIGCSNIALLKIEAGERRPSRQVALLLADFLGVAEDERDAFVLFARSGQPELSPGDTITASDETGSAAPWRAART